jgi:hypothetical protein
MGYAPRGPRELTGGSQNPAGLEGNYFNANTPDVPYVEGQGFQGADARMAQAKNRNTLAEALAKAKGGDKPPTILGMGAPFEGKGGMMQRIEQALNDSKNIPDGAEGARQLDRIRGRISEDITKNASAEDLRDLFAKKYALWDLHGGQKSQLYKRITGKKVDPDWSNTDIEDALKEHVMGTNLGAGSPTMDSDLLKLLMAYGAFGGMSAGALATIDGQKQQGSGF